MTFKLPSRKKKFQENFQIMFQICVPNQKAQVKVAIVTFLIFFINAMIRNIE
jgi:hypothetical protein